MKTTTLAFAFALASVCAFSNTTLSVKKEATLCKGDSCSYTNPSFELSCDFVADGSVKIRKTQTFGMVGPTIALYQDTKYLNSEEVQKLNEAFAVITNQPNALKLSRPQDNIRYVYFTSEYAINERYVLSTEKGKDLWLAQNFSYSSRQMDLPEVDQVIEIADQYCAWTSLTKK